MQDLKKVVPTDRVILEDITLAFLPGAKIGVLGANGAGKSSLLKIMALIDTDFQGEAKHLPGVDWNSSTFSPGSQVSPFLAISLGL